MHRHSRRGRAVLRRRLAHQRWLLTREALGEMAQALDDLGRLLPRMRLSGPDLAEYHALLVGLSGKEAPKGDLSLKATVELLAAEVLTAFCRRAPRGTEVREGLRAYPYRRKAAVRTDAAALISAVRAAAEDRWHRLFVTEDGEVLRPLADVVAEALVAAGALDTPSHRWRSGDVKALGIKLDRYQQTEPGAWAMGWVQRG